MGYGLFIQKIRDRWEKKFWQPKTAHERPREAFAREVGVSLTALSKWENDRGSPRKKKLEKMLELIGLKLERCLYLPDSIIEREQLEPTLRRLINEELDSKSHDRQREGNLLEKEKRKPARKSRRA